MTTRRGEAFAWFMDEVAIRLAMLVPPWRRRLVEHMDGVRAQDVRLHGRVHPRHRRRWLKP